MLLDDVQDSTNNWRNHWFVVNVLVEIPIIGSFFKIKKFNTAMYNAGKSVASLIGGTTSMMSILIPAETDEMLVRVAKTTTSMAIGMTAGKAIYNGTYSTGAMLYQYLSIYRTSTNRIANNDTEMQAMSTAVQQQVGSVLRFELPDATMEC